MKRENKIMSVDAMMYERFGKVGTPERETFREEAYAYCVGQIISDARKSEKAFCLSETWEVWRNQMELVGQLRHLFAEHVTTTWESVQQQNCGFILRFSFTIEDIAIFDLNFPVRYHIS